METKKEKTERQIGAIERIIEIQKQQLKDNENYLKKLKNKERKDG